MLGKLVNGQIIRPDDILFYDDITLKQTRLMKFQLQTTCCCVRDGSD